LRVGVTKDSALIIVDVQRDFMPGGALPVPSGESIIPVINRLIASFKEREMPIIATRDWHPKDHISFKPRGPWPPHCIQGTAGAEFHPSLELPEKAVIVSKGTSAEKEAYSAFQGTGLENTLNKLRIKRLFVCGVATEYCVKETVMDALKRGFQTFVIEDAIKGIDVRGEDKAKGEMLKKGAVMTSSSELAFF